MTDPNKDIDISGFSGNIRTDKKRTFWLITMVVWILSFLLPVLSIFLILLILVQRGRGGGLVGAFGGMGGQSAFGAKAGDVFTRITIITVSIWIVLCVWILLAMKPGANTRGSDFDEGRATEPAVTVLAESDIASATIPLSASQ